MGIKLNIGAGGTELPGHTPIDIKDGKPAFPLDFADGSVEEIYSSHLLEHLSRGDVISAVAEWFRVLQPGGRVRIAVPDYNKLRKSEVMSECVNAVEPHLMGGQIDEHDFHKSQFTFGKLYLTLEQAGFDLVRTWRTQFLDTSALEISLRLEAFKPDPASPPIKLNIGGGSTAIPGFVNIDMKTGGDATSLEYPDSSVDEIYCSHTLEHIHHSRVRPTLKEWVRVLKPGGFIRIAVPNFDKVLEAYRNGEIGMEKISYWAHGSADDDTDRHQCEFNEDVLFRLMRTCGIDDVQPFEAVYNDCSTIPYSINLCGVKRSVLIREKPKVVLVMSRPRFGPSHTMESIIAAVRASGWEYIPHGGTVWGRGMEGVCESAIRYHDPDYIMTLDYDSVFTAEDCFELLRLMQENPDIGALYPAEAHRHADRPLGFDPTRSYSGETTNVTSGHFGCTIVRREVFDTLPHPWFFCLPNPHTGTWDKSIDDDIYFWIQCQIYGFRVCQANQVQIGHLEWCVKWLSDQSKSGVIWQPIQNYEQLGKPKAASFDMEKWQAKFGESAFKSREKAPAQKFNGEPRLITEGQAKELIESNGHAPEPGSGFLPMPVEEEVSTGPVS